MLFKTPHVSFIILNWNSWEDTVECLESVYKSDYWNYNVFLVDNKSTNDSILRILNWANGTIKYKIKSSFPNLIYPIIKKPLHIRKLNYNFQERRVIDKDISINKIQVGELIYILNDTNAGFAGGTNIGIEIAMQYSQSDYIFLLNNDTVIERNTLSELVDNMKKYNINAANSVIYNYYNNNKIDYAGGKLFPWAKVKYYKTIPNKMIRISSFLNGCAMIVDNEVFKKYGLLTEKFFHGEEDFEFSWRLKKTKFNIACICSSKVYHKEGASINTLINKKKQKILISYLNRVIDMKYYFNPLFWKLWIILVSLYYVYLLMNLAKCSAMEAYQNIKKVSILILKLESVDKHIFDSIIKDFN